jgi:predicted ATPase
MREGLQKREKEPIMKTTRPLLKSITPKNLLSFGPSAKPINLKNLNLLIGPNGSGKSNLLEVIGLLRAAPRDIEETIRKGGGISEWIWKGEPKGLAVISATVDVIESEKPLKHRLDFREQNQRLYLQAEVIGDEKEPSRYGSFQDGQIILQTARGEIIRRAQAQEVHGGGFGGGGFGGGERSADTTGSIEPNQSILSQRRDPNNYPEIFYLASFYEKIRLYREWAFGRNTVFREPQKADMRSDRLEEDFSNLGLVLNRLRKSPKAKKSILNYLQDLYEGVSDFDVSVAGGTVQVFLTEGDFTIPATRLSDGTLRYLCLLTILCDPEPPPLICIEEPELGLHPDILPKIAELLLEASQRTQLVVTTHSDILVDALTERPETILICEKHEGRTTIKRLDQKQLQKWLEKYRLGELWIRGELGGTRW